MQINPSLEKHFNRFVLRAFGACVLALCGLLFVGWVFWSLRTVIPPTMAIGLGAISIMGWLFGAKHAFDEVIPDIHEVFEQASDEDLSRVLDAHPASTDIHQLALAVVRKRTEENHLV